MKSILNLFFVFTFFILHGQDFETTLAIDEVKNAPVKLIPYPKDVNWQDEEIFFKALKISDKTGLPNSIQTEWENLLNDNNISEKSSGIEISFTKNLALDKEAYELEVNKSGIAIIASNETGWFYGLQTLRQLIKPHAGIGFIIPAVEIKDAPEFPMRGFMLDVGRNFLPIDFLKEQIDILAKYKMNVFQWHLTDYPAWRIETKTHPELINPKNHRPTRDPGKYYTFNEIRDLFNYAKEKQIQIIPEIDMPGHSTYFKEATGYSMDSEEGKQILKTVLNEFFQEIPSSMSPYIHLGSDEVEINEPEAFMEEMITFVRKYHRKPIAWTPGLPTDTNVIAQIWKTFTQMEPNRPIIDSWNSYINNSEPLTQMPKLLLKPIGNGSNSKVLGGILCLWHDVNIDNNEEMFDFHSVYPAILTYAWRTWSNDITQTNDEFITQFPAKGTTAYAYATTFEDYLIEHRERFFQDKNFYYTKQSDMNWKLEGPYTMVDNHLNPKDSLESKEAVGGTIIIKDRFKQGGYFPEAKLAEVYKGTTYIYSDKSQTKLAWVGFETPLRANRIYQGIPKVGEWDTSGGTIKINDVPLAAPEWKNPGFQLSQKGGWGNAEDKETPWSKEELYWTRPAVPIHLKKGWNKIEITSPGTHDYQNWMFTFVFLNSKGLISSSTKGGN